MSSAIVDGFERGFNMMERHNERIGRNQRLSMLDKRNEDHYQAGQDRLSRLDAQNNERYQDGLDRQQKLDAQNNKRYQDTLDYRKQQTQATTDHRNWQKNQQIKQENWAKDQKLLPIVWDYFRNTGQVRPEFEDALKRNPGYDPRTFQNPEIRQNIKALSGKIEEAISSGKISQVNNPENIQLFNDVFKDKISNSIGSVDPESGKKITDVNFAGFVPTLDKDGNVSKDGSVTFALKVSYENGPPAIKPQTKGGTTEQDDPVLTYKPSEIIAAIQSKMMMADMIERPEYWDKMGNSVGQSLSSGGQQRYSQLQQDKNKASYRREISSIQSNLTKDLAKIESDSSNFDKEASKQRVVALYQQQIDEVNKAYGIETSDDSTDNPPPKYTSKLDGQTVDSIIERFMSANKGMSKEQALSAALKQGYIYGIETSDDSTDNPPPKYTSKVDGQTVDSVIERFMSANKGMSKEQALSAALKQGYISE